MKIRNTLSDRRLAAAFSALLVGSLTIWAAERNETTTSTSSPGRTEVVEGRLLALSHYLHATQNDSSRPNILESQERRGTSTQPGTPGQLGTDTSKDSTDSKDSKDTGPKSSSAGQTSTQPDPNRAGQTHPGAAHSATSSTADMLKSHLGNIEGQPLVLIADLSPMGSSRIAATPAQGLSGLGTEPGSRTSTSTGSPSAGNRTESATGSPANATPSVTMVGEAYILCFASEQELAAAQRLLNPRAGSSASATSTSSPGAQAGTTGKEHEKSFGPAQSRVRVTGTVVQRGSLKAILVSDISPSVNTAGL